MLPREILAAILCALTLITVLAACGKPASLDAEPRDELSVERESTSSTGPDLVGTEWVLVSLRGRTLSEDAEITLEIKADDPYTVFGGHAICNGYGGRNVATEYGAVEINTLDSTLIGCPGDTERTYYESLQEAVAYRVRQERLEMRNTAGKTILVYERERELPDSGGELNGEIRQRFLEGRP